MKIAFLGDMAFFGKYSLDNNINNNPFKNMANYLSQFDLVVGNLETPFCNNCKKKGFKSAHIKSLEENVKILNLLNVKIVNLSNNHILDYGKDGLIKTIDLLTNNNIDYFGINNKQIIYKNEDNIVNFLGYTCPSTNNISYYKKGNFGPNILSPIEIESTLKNTEEKSITVLSFHMGDEHINYPRLDHIKMAKKFADVSDYILYGHHPHVLQGVEKYKSSILAYSLGNFCFDDVYSNGELKVQQSENNKIGAILAVDLKKSKITDYKVQIIRQNDLTIDLVEHDLSFYNEVLKWSSKDYSKFRSEKISVLNKSVKDRRKIQWFIKRLRLKTLGLIFNALKNKKLYNKYLTSYVESEE